MSEPWHTKLDRLEKSHPGWIPIVAAIRRVASGETESVSMEIDSTLVGSSDQRRHLKSKLMFLDPALKVTTHLVFKRGRPWTGKLRVVRKKDAVK